VYVPGWFGGKNVQRRKQLVRRLVVLAIAIVLVALYFIRLPYFVQTPGSARSMTNMVKVEGARQVHGDYRLVYIYLGQANIYQYLWAKFDRNPYTTLVGENTVKIPEENDQSYNLRQQNYMKQAQQSAAYVAYKAAGKRPEMIRRGVLVLGVVPSMPSAKILQSGDRIVRLESQKITTSAQLNHLIGKYKTGSRLGLTIVRGGKSRQVHLTVAAFPKQMATSGPAKGIGVYSSDQLQVRVKPPVKFSIKNIGGPSAGLMMTLDIYDQLKTTDLARGRIIAGTGTIETDGSVGPIGGIAEKIVGADQSNVDVFFAPVADQEYQTAKQTAEAIGSHMKIVPVRTFDDAKNYLLKR
jgi:PDZ domain-containing protein